MVWENSLEAIFIAGKMRPHLSPLDCLDSEPLNLHSLSQSQVDGPQEVYEVVINPLPAKSLEDTKPLQYFS